MANNLFELQQVLQNYGVLISFSGRFSQEIIEELGDAVKKYLETESTSQTETYNVFSIFIEQTQNVKNYCARKEGGSAGEKIANSAIVAIGKSATGHFVQAGNLIESADAPGITAQLDTIIALDKAGLKKYYKELLKADIPPGKMGAGLGLTDMARKASQPLEYHVLKMDADFCFFTLKAYV